MYTFLCLAFPPLNIVMEIRPCCCKLFFVKSHYLFIYRSVAGHLDCSQFGDIICRTALDTLVHVTSGRMHSFLLDIPRSRIAMS